MRRVHLQNRRISLVLYFDHIYDTIADRVRHTNRYLLIQKTFDKLLRTEGVDSKTYKDDHILNLADTVHCMEDGHMVLNITECIEGVCIDRYTANGKEFPYSKERQPYVSNLFAWCAYKSTLFGASRMDTTGLARL